MAAGEDAGAAGPVRVAVIGAGPAGLYTVVELLGADVPVSVDVFDRLPTPYGLVRYGVAPDQVKMKSVIRVMQTPFTDSDVAFFGNVTVGSDITHEELQQRYHAVVYATGSPHERRLGIAGEELDNCCGAASFVNWYSGHPDVAETEFSLKHSDVAVVGAGNVALDIARVLAKSPSEMGETDVPGSVLRALSDSQVHDIHVLIRRGPSQVKFTPPELRLIGQLANADVLVHDPRFGDDPADDLPEDKRARKNVELLRDWAGREPEGKPRRIHLRFFRSPVEIIGADQVDGVVAERNHFTADGALTGTGEYETLDVGLVLTAVGYQGTPLPGVPFDAGTGTVPHTGGRVLGSETPLPGSKTPLPGSKTPLPGSKTPLPGSKTPLPGIYVAGWAKRGPTGVIGTNKSDGAETAHSLLEDLPQLPRPEHPARAEVHKLLTRRGVRMVDWPGWLRLDTHETNLGASQGRARAKLADLETMLEVIADEQAPQQ